MARLRVSVCATGVAVLGLFGLTPSVSAATPFTPTTGDELIQAVADAKAAWTETSEPQEIVLSAKKYETSSEIILNFPVTVRGATGNPADVTVTKKSTGSNPIHRKFTVDHADARLESITVSGGYLYYSATLGACMYGAGVRVAKARSPENDTNASNLCGAGGTVSNCVFTANNITYKGDSAIVYVNGPKDKTLVTCCVITNNTCKRQTDSSGGDSAFGSIVHVDSGRFTSSIVANNKANNDVTSSQPFRDETSVIELRGGSVENCRVNNNSVWDSYDPTVVRILKKGLVFNTVFSDNSVTTSSFSRADWPETSRYWAGVAAGYSNCVFNASTDITLPNDSCICTNKLGYFDEAAKDYRLTRYSVLRRAGEMNGVLTTGADILGKPRVQEPGYIDIGPIAYDPSIVWIDGECEGDGCFEGGRTTFRVTVDEGYGDEPTYYWTLTPVGGGTATTYMTTERETQIQLATGRYTATLTVSNLTAGTGSSITLANQVQAHQQRFYAKAGNPTAAFPYATEETASADLQKAIDAVTRDGAEVVALPGVFKTASNILVRTHQITLRGSTGNPEDVRVCNTNKTKWTASTVYDEASGFGEGRCLVLDAGPAARVESMTFEGGYAMYASQYGAGMYLASWTKRSVRPDQGRGGVVSNCVVRNCQAGGKYGTAPGIYANGANYLITHTVVSNCTSDAGNVNGGRFIGVALELGKGAKAEHCLIRGNKSNWSISGGKQYPNAGRGHACVLLRENSKLRFSTVVNNTCSMVGGVNVNDPEGRVEGCIILGNKAQESLLCPVTTNRFNCWAMMSFKATDDLLYSGRPGAGAPTWDPAPGWTPTGEDKLALVSSNEIKYVAANAAAVDAAFRNTITDYAIAGSTGILSSKDEVFRNAAKADFRLKSNSPAVNRIEPSEAGDMPSVDLMGNPRLDGPKYDLGCYEAIIRGLMMFVR